MGDTWCRTSAFRVSGRTLTPPTSDGTPIILRFVIAAVLLGACFSIASIAYVRDMRRAYDRIRDRAQVIASPVGDIEWVEGGQGTPVLVVHGSGGGFDQGELVARALLDDGVRWIAPSRFGYLRSTFHEGATFDDQARAFVVLLDQLGIDRVGVVALSHGGPSALLFAVLYPERVSSLSLVSAGVAATASDAQPNASRQGKALTAIFQRDYRYWALATMFRSQLLKLMGASREVIAGLSPEQRTLVDEVIEFMNPVAPRAAGVRFDNTAAMPNERISAVRAPTLILHAKDDTLQVYDNATFAAAHINGSELVSFDRGGHLLLAVEQPALRARVMEHIRRHAGR